jgi:hypothetical protein
MELLNPALQSGLRLTASLDPLIHFWRQVAQGEGPHRWTAQALLDYLKNHPDLEGPLQPELLQHHKEFVESLVSCVLPAGLRRFSFAALARPATYDILWSTPRFYSELLDAEGKMAAQVYLEGMHWDYLRELFNYLSVARRVFGRDFPFQKSVVLERKHPEHSWKRYFQMRAHFEHQEIRSPQPLPVISEQAWQRLAQDLDDLDLWRKTLPLERFELYGLVIYEATEITEEVTLSAIKQELVAKDPLRRPQSFQRIQQGFQALLGLANLELKVMGQSHDHLLGLTPEGSRQQEIRILSEQLSSECLSQLRQGSSWVIEDLSQVEPCSALLAEQASRGQKSLLWMPLRYEGNTVGLLQLTSATPHVLNNLTPYQLQEISPLLSLAVKRSLDGFEQRVEAVMKERFTALHPAVEWKFRRQALDILNEDHDLEKISQDIVFADVYPLFGASDVRNSTVIRNRTIEKDLGEQLELASQVLERAYQQRQLTYLCSRRYRLQQWIDRLSSGLDSGDESRLLDFLRSEVEPLFPTLAKFGEDVAEAISAYQSQLDPRLGILYRERRQYEYSMGLIKERTAAILSRRQAEAQQVFPHYFEMHQSDGVDHMLYVGASIHPEGAFEQLYLRNLRLWQLETMIEIARESQSWTSEMECVLESAHLLLVQDRPLSIRFNQDEKQFNVDGAYNARYEILKKRLDKAEVLGTGERLTQPGKVAIVYSHPREAQEYRDYIDYLQHEGELTPALEELEIAPLQGVQGLRALRISVAAYQESDAKIA